MKIGIIVRKLNVNGGVQRHVFYLARELKKLGHSIKLYTFIYDKEGCYPELLGDMEVVSFGYLPQPPHLKILGYFNYFIGLAREASASKKLAALIDRDTQILNPHDHVCYKVAYFFKRRVKNIPSVWMMHDLPTKTFSLIRGQAIGAASRISPIKRLFYRFVDSYEIGKYIKKQDAIAVLDGRDQQWAKEYFDTDAVIIRNGVDVEKFKFTARQALVAKQAQLLMNGIFMPHRRFEDGIEALKILIDRGYDARLEITGGAGENQGYYDKIQKLVSSLQLNDRVKFLGQVSEAELLESYRRNQIFLFPNHLQSWGLAVFEAMATGLPVIVSKSAGASEVLSHRENALLVQPKSPDELATAIAELIENPSLYGALSATGRLFVEKEISWLRTALMMQKIFSTLASKA